MTFKIIEISRLPIHSAFLISPMHRSPTPAALTLAHAEGRATSVAAIAAGTMAREADLTLSPAAERKLNRLLAGTAAAFAIAVAALVVVPLVF